MKYIAESVTKYHPDKICDQISDAVLDACLEQDPNSRVAVEVLGGHGTLVLIGEVTTKAEVDYNSVANNKYYELVGKEIGVLSNINKQSPDISVGVDTGGAGDQGIMVGYACRENDVYMPQEMFLSRKILEPFKVDGKSQVVIIDGKIDNVVLAVQHETQEYLRKYLKDMFGNIDTYCNNTGSYDIGGFDSDSGCTGRKIVVDAYGPRVPVGGGAFSGKDPSKVDRSAAYMSRFIALQLLKKYGAQEVTVQLGYVIGKAEPLLQVALVDGQETTFKYDCRPQSIIERFDLKRPIYTDTSANGHFGRKSLPWEKYE